MKLFYDQIRITLISQLIKSISRVLQKLFDYINGTGISTFIVPAVLVLFDNLDLNLDDSNSAVSALFNRGSSLKNVYKLRHIFE